MSSLRRCSFAADVKHFVPIQPRKYFDKGSLKTMCTQMHARNDAGACGSSPQGLPRRDLLLLGLVSTALAAGDAQAIGFKKELKKRKIPIEEYSELPNGLKYYDLIPGKGAEVAPGTTVTVHFDCLFRGIDVVSSRSARLLGGNRSVAEPLQFVAGEPISTSAKKIDGDTAGGLFSGAGGPKPPVALSTAVVGMKPGGKRSIIVTPEYGYGDVGEQEIGPGQTFELQIELLAVA